MDSNKIINMDKIINAEFDKRSVPFDGSPTAKQLLDSLDGSQRAAAEEFIYSLGDEQADRFIQSMTPEKLKLLFEIHRERRVARLAVARWNFLAKAIKWSFFSLSLSMTAGYLVGWLLLDGSYDLFDVLKGYVGIGWMKCWFVALFAGSVHNIYDSVRVWNAVKKITSFCKDWLRERGEEEAPKKAKKKS